METLPDSGLTSFPGAVAVAVITSPAWRVSPVKLQTPFALEVVFPTDTLFEKTSMPVPLPSVVVPETVFIVVLVQYAPKITGANDGVVTVCDTDGSEIQSIPDIALTVMTWPKESVNPETVQFVAEAVVVATFAPSAYRMMIAPEADVPDTEVVVVKIGFVVIKGVAVVEARPRQTKNGSDSHSPLNAWVIRYDPSLKQGPPPPAQLVV